MSSTINVCEQCYFFMPDNNPDSTIGCCRGVPVETVDENGRVIDRPNYPRRARLDLVCGLFKQVGPKGPQPD